MAKLIATTSVKAKRAKKAPLKPINVSKAKPAELHRVVSNFLQYVPPSLLK